jgi:hypothetical protein
VFFEALMDYQPAANHHQAKHREPATNQSRPSIAHNDKSDDASPPPLSIKELARRAANYRPLPRILIPM